MHDVDAQKKGVVMVILNVGPNKMAFENISFMMKSKRTFDSLPFRTSAMHYCYDDMMLYPFITFVQFLLMSRIKGRFVHHYGKLCVLLCLCSHHLGVGVGIWSFVFCHNFFVRK